MERELAILVGLAPLLRAQMLAPFGESVIATDASGSGFAVVATPAHPAVAEALAASAPVLPPPPPFPLTNPDNAHTVASARWSTIISSPFRVPPHHINEGECIAVVSAVKWALSRPHLLGCRLVVLTDSAVVAAVLSKGRCSAFAMLRHCRLLAALLLASSCTVVPRWIPSHLNPADEPSRRFEHF